MARRQRDRSAERFEAIIKLILIFLLVVSFAIGGTKGFSHVFASLVYTILATLIVGVAIGALGVVVYFLLRSRPSRRANQAPPVDSSNPALVRKLSESGDLEPVSDAPKALTLELLAALEWKRFEEVGSAYFELLGFRTEETPIGPDGGIDIKLYRDDANSPTALVQCKAWHGVKVGVKPIRELYGVMAAEGVEHGVFLTSSRFSEEAQAFAEGKEIDLIDGETFLSQVRQLPEESQRKLLNVATDGDYSTPTCPSCGVKMVERTARKGAQIGSRFWGCPHYPRCKRKFPSKGI